MAEIKSTMELVMERLARMDLDNAPDLDDEEERRQGMRLAAAYMRGEELDPASLAKPAVRKGVVEVLLRHLVLPREESQQEDAGRAMTGLLAVAGRARDLQAACGELKSILERYLGHRRQLRRQLEDAFAGQMQQLEAAMAQQTGMAMRLEPSQHPKFQEEWQRLVGELDDQYGRAVEQYKDLIRQRLLA